jgi:hypothetical protein
MPPHGGQVGGNSESHVVTNRLVIGMLAKVYGNKEKASDALIAVLC